MVIENRNLTPVTRLVATFKKAHYACMVTPDETGKLMYVLENGLAFKSPSAAASSVMGGIAANGWRFWSVEGEAPAPAETPAKAPKAEKPAKEKSTKTIRRVANQKGVPEGGVRWFCDGCMQSFVATADDVEPACPAGHRNPVPATAQPA